MTATPPSELTVAADALARIVAELLPHAADPQLAHQFRLALGNLLAATLSGATVMAAGVVVALDTKLNREITTRGDRLYAMQREVDRLSARMHALEDEFLDGGQVGQMAQAMHQMAIDIGVLKEKAVADGDG